MVWAVTSVFEWNSFPGWLPLKIRWSHAQWEGPNIYYRSDNFDKHGFPETASTSQACHAPPVMFHYNGSLGAILHDTTSSYHQRKRARELEAESKRQTLKCWWLMRVTLQDEYRRHSSPTEACIKMLISYRIIRYFSQHHPPSYEVSGYAGGNEILERFFSGKMFRAPTLRGHHSLVSSAYAVTQHWLPSWWCTKTSTP